MFRCTSGAFHELNILSYGIVDHKQKFDQIIAYDLQSHVLNNFSKRKTDLRAHTQINGMNRMLHLRKKRQSTKISMKMLIPMRSKVISKALPYFKNIWARPCAD